MDPWKILRLIRFFIIMILCFAVSDIVTKSYVSLTWDLVILSLLLNPITRG